LSASQMAFVQDGFSVTEVDPKVQPASGTQDTFGSLQNNYFFN
jgi:hypothetical protein